MAAVRTFWYANTSVEIDIDAETLWLMYSWVKKGGAEVRVKCKVGRRELWLGLQHLNASKTFEKAILDAYEDSMPPALAEAHICHDPSLPPPPRIPTLPSVGNERDTDPEQARKTPVGES